MEKTQVEGLESMQIIIHYKFKVRIDIDEQPTSNDIDLIRDEQVPIGGRHTTQYDEVSNFFG